MIMMIVGYWLVIHGMMVPASRGHGDKEDHTKDVWHDNLLGGDRTCIHSKIRTDEGAPPTA
ncbi:MAG: hypothetical protein E2P02_28735 [Acidobacteria bacterium]|nr:MAG: hypothetical protein E2P02_28735 [Acidobacteriota bacterium]